METIKAYTDIEQSRKLANILPLDSADMKYFFWENDTNTPKIPTFRYNKDVAEFYKETTGVYLPCWSLAALLEILPKGTNISIPKSTNELSYCCWNDYGEFYVDNIIDACYKMILRLNKLKLL